MQIPILSEIWGLLKSDHFGIEISEEFDNAFMSVVLKSDHFGIEIDYLIDRETGLGELKSDHFGIEMCSSG